MTTDDFKQKCDEIRRMLCYLDDNNHIPIGDIFEPINVWFGHVEIKWEVFTNQSVLECAIKFVDRRNEILNMDGKPEFSKDKWTIE